MTPDEAMRRIDTLLSHVWMVRAFLKHSDEAAQDEELQDIHRALYDFHLAVGPAWQRRDAADYLHLARKKFSRLRQASDDFTRIGPEVSTHTNFQMAAQSLAAAVEGIGNVLMKMDSDTAKAEGGRRKAEGADPKEQERFGGDSGKLGEST